MTPRKALAGLLLVAALGLSVAGTVLWRATTVSHPEVERARERIAALRDSLDTAGHPGGQVRTLHALAWQPDELRMVQASAPLWFLQMKEPAVGWVLRGVDFDLSARGITVGNMREQGPGLVLDEEDPAGGTLLLWLE